MKQRKTTLLTTTLFLFGAVLTAGCPDGPAEDTLEDAGQNIDNAADKTGDAIDDTIDNTEDAIDDASDN